ncbi:predicted protein [Uncinocarpus reesii 1704]|uniref:Uncharacterized protein n=1 Tax=Uncinocarpus reesii (strain UAMH 1704) TaxID=336963 RepID=C4JZM4_UNCRE|nr:uncharacterized protein UREG_07625 [Uncinocarpus reesii 1704]EEP82760.1 predicted protein [Uncinocarpus reesii 1704]
MRELYEIEREKHPFEGDGFRNDHDLKGPDTIESRYSGHLLILDLAAEAWPGDRMGSQRVAKLVRVFGVNGYGIGLWAWEGSGEMPILELGLAGGPWMFLEGRQPVRADGLGVCLGFESNERSLSCWDAESVLAPNGRTETSGPGLGVFRIATRRWPLSVLPSPCRAQAGAPQDSGSRGQRSSRFC